MKRLTALSVPLLTLAIAGCGEESDQLPVDGREFDGVNYSEPAPYQGRVIDGYLRNARVWLDVNGDGKYTAESFTVELDNGNSAVIEGGEPMAMSGQDGAFSLDLAALQLSPQEGRPLDPRDYPLFAAAIPGTTVEQTEVGDQAIAVGYVLSANPGVRNVTPLTTLARYQTALELMPGGDLGESLAGINVTADYIRGQDDRAHAYARALVKFMTQQVASSMPERAGAELSLSPEEARLLGTSLLRHAPAVITAVDQAAGDDYSSVAIDTLELPDVTVSITDPLVLTGQQIFARAESGELPVAPDNLVASSGLEFEYGEDGRLAKIAANGCLALSMRELARLIVAGGYMGGLSTQWLPSVSLAPAGWDAFNPENDPDQVVDETLTFDWGTQTIEFQTSTLCHAARGIEPASTELGAGAEVSYSWSEQDGAISELVATVGGVGAIAGVVYRLAPGSGELVADYTITKDGQPLESVERQGEPGTCEPVDEETAQENFVVTETLSYLFTGYEPQPTTFTDLAFEYDTRTFSADGVEVEVNRLLRYAFLDPALAGSGNVAADAGFQWLLHYDATPDVNAPNLIREAYLSDYSVRSCGTGRPAPARAYAKVEYSYMKLSEYLLEAIQ
ncbi:hypothetical protein [Marinobacter sp. UBA3607]|jgi:hypothetical protein|uniref:hypothetical protein n=1 Tax=Marinobacter sp. UBA3607 TaxID=1946820 RepID=UPI0025797CCB|nr:hypothetical protein [Marinobacter sp. UBA3607]|tara:strand:+ start:23389 stop:25251 length:1863 start_codon:yes stop_codon:yes gene_type:complete